MELNCHCVLRDSTRPITFNNIGRRQRAMLSKAQSIPALGWRPVRRRTCPWPFVHSFILPSLAGGGRGKKPPALTPKLVARKRWPVLGVVSISLRAGYSKDNREKPRPFSQNRDRRRPWVSRGRLFGRANLRGLPPL